MLLSLQLSPGAKHPVWKQPIHKNRKMLQLAAMNGSGSCSIFFKATAEGAVLAVFVFRSESGNRFKDAPAGPWTGTRQARTSESQFRKHT